MMEPLLRATNVGKTYPGAIEAFRNDNVMIELGELEALDEALAATTFFRERLPFSAAFLAGKAFLAYQRRGGTKQSLLPDFLIGAHAAISGFQLLTRDAARYRTYFPHLHLIAPAN